MIKKIVLLLCLSFFANAGEITIAVAANVSYAIDELKDEFNKTYPDTKVIVTLGSSGKLTAQIKNGAPYELFLAANMGYPEALYKEGVAVTKPIIYAQGALAFLSKNELNYTQGIQLLSDPSIKKIAIANPETAPYGKAALEAMEKSGIYENIKEKLVFAESISQTVTYALTAADIGIIAKSSLYSSNMAEYKEGVNWSEVDTGLYTPIDQGIVVLKNGEANSEARAFYDFMLSPKAKEILLKYGYMVP
jgi:molybdate transport system substrate-binding protein